jgi:uncharacterized protein YdcH (DUF465 family)
MPLSIRHATLRSEIGTSGAVFRFRVHKLNERKGRVSMSHTPHELAEEFPGKTQAIHELKASNAHFTKLVEDYHTVNRAVHRAETGVEPTDGRHETELRKRRMALKDAIATMLNKAS